MRIHINMAIFDAKIVIFTCSTTGDGKIKYIAQKYTLHLNIVGTRERRTIAVCLLTLLDAYGTKQSSSTCRGKGEVYINYVSVCVS